MTTYSPAAEILPYFTDEALRQRTAFGPELSDLLLTIPAEFRQPAAAEQHHRSKKTTYVETPSGREAWSVPVGDAWETWREVIAEVARQVAAAGVR
jgi:hypothetical protein